MARSWQAVLVWLPAMVAVGCVAPSGSPDGAIIMDVAANTVECQGEAVQRCLLVRRAGEDNWTRFYGTIDGFSHEEGHAYRIEVERRAVKTPPADGSSYEYRLLRVVWRRP